MTLNKFIKELQAWQKAGYGRTQVTINIEHHRKHTPPEYSHFAVDDIDSITLPWAKDDSFELADGSERIRTVLELK